MRRRGEFSFSTVVFFVLLAVVGWIATHSALGYYSKVKVEGAMTNTVLTTRGDVDDATLVEMIKTAVAAEEQLTLDSCAVFRSVDGVNIRISGTYKYYAHVPLMSKPWIFVYEPSVDVKLR